MLHATNATIACRTITQVLVARRPENPEFLITKRAMRFDNRLRHTLGESCVQLSPLSLNACSDRNRFGGLMATHFRVSETQWTRIGLKRARWRRPVGPTENGSQTLQSHQSISQWARCPFQRFIPGSVRLKSLTYVELARKG